LRILVTGAAGFIGSHLAAKLAKQNHEILGVDSFSNYYSIELKGLREDKILKPLGVSMRKSDLAEEMQLRKVFEDFRPDCVFHLAAQAGIRIPVNQYSSYLRNNVTSFSNILNEIIHWNTPYLLYASSSSVYGNGSKIPLCESELLLKPTSFYGGTKLSNEILVESLKDKVSTKFIGLRFFTVYGGWGRPDMSYFRLINSALNKTEFNLFGDGSIRRDFTYIDDVTESLVKILKNLVDGKFNNEIFNIGGGNPYSINDLISITEKLSGMQVKVNLQDSNLQDVAKTEADYSKLLKFTGYVPNTDLESGMNKTYEWVIKNGFESKLNEWVKSSI
jgi:UDP-glucuronate 4-epimerase